MVFVWSIQRPRGRRFIFCDVQSLQPAQPPLECSSALITPFATKRLSRGAQSVIPSFSLASDTVSIPASTPMSSSCVVPVSPVGALKRARSADDDLRLLKVSKHASDASPHSPRVVAAAVLAQRQRQQQILHHRMMQQQQQQQQQHEAVSPFVLACGNIRYAITFIQNSRRHALALCLQNQWERALTVLEKIERANDKISRQRRTKVREQANADADHVFDALAMPAQQPQVPSPVKATKPKKHVRFSDEVQVAEAEVVDRSPVPMPMLMLIRDEILVLRASRPIPLRNFSEFWSSSL